MDEKPKTSKHFTQNIKRKYIHFCTCLVNVILFYYKYLVRLVYWIQYGFTTRAILYCQKRLTFPLEEMKSREDFRIEPKKPKC